MTPKNSTPDVAPRPAAASDASLSASADLNRSGSAPDLSRSGSSVSEATHLRLNKLRHRLEDEEAVLHDKLKHFTDIKRCVFSSFVARVRCGGQARGVVVGGVVGFPPPLSPFLELALGLTPFSHIYNGHSAIARICQNDEAYLDNPDIIKVRH